METYYAPGEQPETPEPSGRPAEDWAATRVVGKPLPRIDAYERVSGSAVFPSDVQLPGMLHAAVLRSPHPHARVREVDVSKAEKMPGVHAVIHDGSSSAQIAWHPDGKGNPVSRLFDPHCRHEGEEIAAVAAETPYQAWDAVRAIAVDYEVLPAVVEAEDALAPGAPEVREGGNRVPGQSYERGDVAAGFAAADDVVEMRFSTAAELHAPLELHGCVVRWEGNRLTVWESTQGVYAVQGQVAAALGLPLAHVRVIGHYVGGGFGSKLSTGKWSVIAALLAKRTGRPVRLFLTREESFLVAGNRPANVMRLKAGVKRDGTLTAFDFDGIGSGGAYSENGTGILDWLVRDLYTCANVRCTNTNVFTHAGTERAMRAPGHPQGAWALEQVMDELARRIGMDPVELRRRNVPRVSQGRGGMPYTTTGLAECLDDGARAFGWVEARARAVASRREGGVWARGVGMGAGLWIGGAGGAPATVFVKYFVDGSVNLNMGASDIGTGTKTVMAMIVAEELGVPLEKIQVEHADTGTTQYATASGGSKTVPTEGPAVRAAALDCAVQLVAMAAADLKLPAAELELRDGAVVAKADPGKRLALGEISELRRRRLVVGVGYRGRNPEGTATCPFAAQFCEVEVNRLTGEVRVVRFLGAHESGRVMNRMTYDNQVYGGITMGIGLALTERRVLDRGQTGKMCNLSWHDYKIPTALDVPAEVVSLPIDLPAPAANLIGAKGLGEPVTIPTAPAIANAVFDAVGVRITDTPVNPTRLAGKIAAAAAEGEVVTMLPAFAYARPRDLAEAVRELASPGAHLHAGGTDLLGCLRDGVFAAEKVVSLRRVAEGREIAATPEGGLRLGALVPIAEIAASPLVRERFRGLAQAAGDVASPQLRNQGTLGGNLCQRPRCWYYRGEFACLKKGGDLCSALDGENRYHAIFGGGPCFIVHPSDTAPMLVAFDATLRLLGPGGERQLPLGEFFQLPTANLAGENALAAGELVAEVEVPDRSGWKSSYRKVRERGAWDFALTSVALALRWEGATVAEARVVLGGVAPIPWRSEAAEARLVGRALDSGTARDAAAAAAEGAEPLSQNGYKVALVRGAVEESLLAFAAG